VSVLTKPICSHLNRFLTITLSHLKMDNLEKIARDYADNQRIERPLKSKIDEFLVYLQDKVSCLFHTHPREVRKLKQKDDTETDLM